MAICRRIIHYFLEINMYFHDYYPNAIDSCVKQATGYDKTDFILLYFAKASKIW